jgi:outer membrane protein TolC
VQYSLSSLWKNKSKVEQARSRQKQIEITQGIVSDNIRLEINRTYQNYILSQKKIEVYQKAIDQATENYRIVKNKFENSLATTTDVLDADVALLQTKINYSNAKADAVLAYNQLLQSAGLLTYTK